MSEEREEILGKVRQGVQLTRTERFEEAMQLFESCLPPLAEGDIADKRAAAAAFSYYGLCVAKVKRRYAEAVKYCSISLRAHPYDPDHRANLALVYLERNDRRRAVEQLNKGLRLQTTNPTINQVYSMIGRRQRPVVPFLPRSNPINVWLGKKRRGRGAP